VTTADTTVVGFIGLGDQGLPIAIALAEAGYELHAWDRNERALEALAGVKHVPETNAEQLAGACDVVALCVNTDADTIDVVSENLLGGLRRGSVVVNHGTGTPANAVRLTELCAAAGVEVLDAPVSGGRPAAAAKIATTMIGGPESVAVKCEPLFRTFCRHIFYLGGPGAGQTAKLFNNTLMMMNQANIADIVERAVEYGMDSAKLVEVLKVSSANSRALELLNTMITADTVNHLVAVQLVDMEIFDEAMSERGVAADREIARATEGTNALAKLLGRLQP
jgi:3-hydroxyisobutyrate dehydrogenase-like beta-hydroxyacid dehydrogenase